MTRFYVLFILIICLPCAAGAEDLVMGKVVSIDREGGRLTISVPESGKTDNGPAPDQIEVKLEDGSIPEGLRKGSLVRIWVKSQGSGKPFIASRIGQVGGMSDRTGIRLRLKKTMRGRGSGGGSMGHGQHGRR